MSKNKAVMVRIERELLLGAHARLQERLEGPIPSPDRLLPASQVVHYALEVLDGWLRGELAILDPEASAAFARQWNETVADEAAKAAQWAADCAGPDEWRVEAVVDAGAEPADGRPVTLRMVNRLTEGVGLVDTYQPGRLDPSRAGAASARAAAERRAEERETE